MLTVSEEDGRVSSFPRDKEFIAWDIWCRKYVLLGCEYYLDICHDETLKSRIVEFLCAQADYILQYIGRDGLKITKASNAWLGINSSSILEPIVRLHKLTGRQRYLNFAEYIVTSGGAEDINIFELAYENKLLPYQYGVSKAYEMMSCFEGLLDYYFITGIEKHKIAVINFAKAVLDSEISIIGTCGVTHELFDHTKLRQTVPYDGVIQETCVTVTWMKFCSRLLDLTGDSIFADAMEQSFYNAYLGSLNTEFKDSADTAVRNASGETCYTYLPVDSYSPLTPGKRGQKVGGFQILPDRSYYGCCACISAAGAGVFLKSAVTVSDNIVTVNFYEQGKIDLEVCETPVRISMDTQYPIDGNVLIQVQAQSPVQFTLKTRNPGWASMPGGYAVYTKQWFNDTITLNFTMPVQSHHPIKWDTDVIYTEMSKPYKGYYSGGPLHVTHNPKDDRYIAFTRGPLTLAADSRTGKPADSIFTFDASRPSLTAPAQDVPSNIRLTFTDAEGKNFFLVDYASAGRDWESIIAAWLPTN